MKANTTIIRAVVTEKSSLNQEKGQYTFVVARDASKIDVKNAIKNLYGVEVDSVKTSIMPKKVRVIGRAKVLTKRGKTKKATITIKGGKKLDIYNFKEESAPEKTEKKTVNKANKK